MITETPALQRQINPEGRFVTLIKNEFVKHAKEINRLNKEIQDIDGSGGTSPDLSNYYTKQQTNNKIAEAISSIDGITDTNTTYRISKSSSTISLIGSDGSTTSVTDTGTQDESIPTSMIDALF